MDYTAQGHTVGLAQRMETARRCRHPYSASPPLVQNSSCSRAWKSSGQSGRRAASSAEGIGAFRTRLDHTHARPSRLSAAMTMARSTPPDRAEEGQPVVGVVADPGPANRCVSSSRSVAAPAAWRCSRRTPWPTAMRCFRSRCSEFFGVTPQTASSRAQDRRRLPCSTNLVTPAVGVRLPGCPDPTAGAGLDGTSASSSPCQARGRARGITAGVR